jgi:hypothetical protein
VERPDINTYPSYTAVPITKARLMKIVLAIAGVTLLAALCAFFGLEPWVRPTIDGDDSDEIQTIFERKKLK